MTIGIAILILWAARFVMKYIASLEEEAVGTSCLAAIIALAYIVATIWLIVRCWSIPL